MTDSEEERWRRHLSDGERTRRWGSEEDDREHTLTRSGQRRDSPERRSTVEATAEFEEDEGDKRESNA